MPRKKFILKAEKKPATSEEKEKYIRNRYPAGFNTEHIHSARISRMKEEILDFLKKWSAFSDKLYMPLPVVLDNWVVLVIQGWAKEYHQIKITYQRERNQLLIEEEASPPS